MFTLIPTNQFKKDLKKVLKRSKNNFSLITEFLEKLTNDGVNGIELKFRPHKLTGNYKDNWEAHIKPDLLIVWIEVIDDKEIILIRIGSHSDLF